MAGCSGDDPPAAPGTGGTGAGGTGATAGTGTAGTGTAGTGTAGGSTAGVQLIGTAAHTYLTSAEAPAGAAAPPTGMASCGTCHGPNGQGVENLAPELRHTPVDFMKAVVRAGRKDYKGDATGMAAFPATGASSISDAELDAYAAWAAGLPKPTTGEALYKSMCGNCHGPKMPTGGGSPIKIQGAASARVDMFVRNGGTGTDVNDRLKYMPKYDTTLLTDAELALIKTFIGAI